VKKGKGFVPRTIATWQTDPTRQTEPDRDKALAGYIGAMLRQTRNAQGLTVIDVSELTGLSRGMVSKIENGQVATSLASLARMTEALGLTFSQLFRIYDSPLGGAQYTKAGEGIEVIRRGTKKGHTYHLLTHDHSRKQNFEPFLISMNDESEAFPIFKHEGTQFIYMLVGTIAYRHGKEVYTLNAGDALTFDARVPHGPEELIDVPIQFLAITIFEEIH
jgi:transcriptional regulator with XRE-family HTH domain